MQRNIMMYMYVWIDKIDISLHSQARLRVYWPAMITTPLAYLSVHKDQRLALFLVMHC